MAQRVPGPKICPAPGIQSLGPSGGHTLPRPCCPHVPPTLTPPIPEQHPPWLLKPKVDRDCRNLFLGGGRFSLGKMQGFPWP